MSDNEFQPLDGDADFLQAKAAHYADIANAIARSVNTLGKINDVDDMKSKATAELRNKAEEVAKDIDRARDRYATTATALDLYSRKLRSAQDKASSALVTIDQASSDADHAHRTSAVADHKLTDSASSSTPDPDLAQDRAAADKAHADAREADRTLSAAKDLWHEARAEKEAAAKEASASIVGVIEGRRNNGLKDGFWDNVSQAMSVIYSALKVVCEWAAILSIFLSWVPILGQILVALAAVGALINLIGASIKFAQGGSFTDLLFAAGGFVLTVCGAKLIEMASTGIRGVMVARAAEQITSTGVRAEKALARMQGVSRHSPDFMTTGAANAAKTALKDSASSLRGLKNAAGTAFRDSVMPAVEDGSKLQQFTSGVKEAFTLAPKILYPDLVKAWQMGIRNPSLLDGKLVLSGLGVTALNAGAVAFGAVGDIRAGEKTGGVSEGYTAVSHTPQLISDTADVIHDFGHIL